MKFGVGIQGLASMVPLTRTAEELGYDSAWFGDTPTVQSDPFAIMTLAAAQTERIRLCLGLAIPFLRMPHVLANGMATLNVVAPGRVELGIGTGYSAAFTLNIKPARFSEILEQIEVCRAWFAGKEADMLIDGRRRPVAFLHPEYRFLNTSDRIPIYLGASGPKGIRLSGEHTDGLVTFTSGESEGTLRAALEPAQSAASARGVTDFQVVLLTAIGIRDPQEPIDSQRLREMVGPYATVVLHGLTENMANFDNAEFLPEAVRVAAAKYTALPLREDAPWIDRHRGHHLYVRPDEQDVLTPEFLSEVAMIGTPDELIQRIRRLEEAGVTEVYWQAQLGHEDELGRFAQKVIEPYRRRY